MTKSAQIWLKQRGEPELWYSRFCHFYLLISYTEPSVRLAYIEYVRYEFDKKTKWAIRLLKQDPELKNIDENWIKAAEAYKWKERYNAYRNHNIQKALKAEDETLIDVTKRRIILASQQITVDEICYAQWLHNYGNPMLDHGKTIDGLNIFKMAGQLTDNSEKSIKHYTKAIPLKDLIDEYTKKQDNEDQ